METKIFKKIIFIIFVLASSLLSLLSFKYFDNQSNKYQNINLNVHQGNSENFISLKQKSKKQDIHIKGNQSSSLLNVIWASEKGNDAFYLSGESLSYFKTELGNQGYNKINLSNLLNKKSLNEVVQNFSLGGANYYNDGKDKFGSIAFWTKTKDNKYHIYTAGAGNYHQLGRQDNDEGYKTFKRIENPTNNSEDFDEIKELSLTMNTLTIWTKDKKGNDHIYFGGINFGQFGDNYKQNESKNKLVEETKNIKDSIKGKIKDIAFDYNNSGFILTEDNKLFAAGQNTHGELGLPKKDKITTFKEIEKPKDFKGKIKQMVTQVRSWYSYQSLILLTDKNELWGLGYDGSYNKDNNKESYELGVKPNEDDYLTKLTKIPLEGTFSKGEKILYTQTSKGVKSAYSILVTESNDKKKHKIYIAGDSYYFNSEHPEKWTYDDDLTKKIFGYDKKTGLNINFNIKNLGNTRYNMPIILSLNNITAFGLNNKDETNQEESLVLGTIKFYNSWKTSYKNEPKHYTVISTLQIILIVLGSFLFGFLVAAIALLLLRKKTYNAFAKYEAKQMNLDSESYSLSNIVQNRSKKQTKEAIKDWKKRMKQDKKFK